MAINTITHLSTIAGPGIVNPALRNLYCANFKRMVAKVLFRTKPAADLSISRKIRTNVSFRLTERSEVTL